MKSRLKASSVLLGATAAALFAVAPAQAAPPAPASPGQNCAAGYMADPNSGNCWQMASKGTPTVGGGPCLPGRIGTCVGYLANNPYGAGDTLPGSPASTGSSDAPDLTSWP
ncbi:hypothetical protein [Mycolicibacterium sp.]|uniref:hypothetical protein n=1 Tax=Mycolicibacterium sp. TaxID=2320850 RepID=UPI001DF9720C|nr:hypothetical protein [Mycolicibacterium sp.]MCB1291364.1 hypothetical protein [Mycobacterium sp.]MCB9409336.1 hypothetical protein [Mycolicibacterium sp.]